MFLLTALALLGTVLACNLPVFSRKEGGLSQEEALHLVLEEIVQPEQLGDDPTVVFAWPEMLQNDDELHPYNFGEDPTPVLIDIASESWFFWVEDRPYAQYAHPSRFVLVNIENGKISSSDQEWWPVLNGEGLWTNTEEYQNEKNWAWSNVTFEESRNGFNSNSLSVLAALIQPQMTLSQTETGKRRAVVINAFHHEQTHTDTGESDASNMIRILDKTDFETTYLGGDFADRGLHGVDTPFTKRGTSREVPDPWETELRKQAEELKAGDTLVVYVGGHGVPEGRRINNENGDIQSQELRDELKEFNPDVEVIVILQGCRTGEWLKDLKNVANLTITATSADKDSYGDFDYRFFFVLGLLSNVDLNPNDEGSEYTSSLVASWEEILRDPKLLEKVEMRAKNEGIGFLQALISEAHKGGYSYDLSARLKLSSPQISLGSNIGRQRAPDDSPDPSTPTPTESSAPPASGDSREACAVFEEIEIPTMIVRHVRDCKPTLNFHYKMDTSIPGLVSASTIPWEYSVLVNGKQGSCFLEEGFDDRLYCRVDISANEAYTLGHFVLFAKPCLEPIMVLDQTIPKLEGCGGSQTEPVEPTCNP